MKYLIVFLIFTSIGYSQTEISGFKLENKKVKWQHVYQAPNIPADSLQQVFITNILSTINTGNLSVMAHRISFFITDDAIDFRKYGATWVYVIHPQNYFIIIDFKENKYRITCSEFKTNFIQYAGILELNLYATKKKRTIFSTNKTVLKGLSYLEKHLLEKFDIKTTLKQNDKW